MILSKYVPYSTPNLRSHICIHFSDDKSKQLPKLLEEYKSISDGSLGTWDTDPVDFKLKDRENPA